MCVFSYLSPEMKSQKIWNQQKYNGASKNISSEMITSCFETAMEILRFVESELLVSGRPFYSYALY